MASSTLTIDDLPGIQGAERDNRRGRELFVASEISESLLATAYLLMEKEGLLETVFYESIPSLSTYLSWLQNKTSRYLGCFIRPTLDVDDVRLAGLSWLWDIRGPVGGRRCECGMVFFREWQRDHIPEELTEKTMDYAFGPCGIDVLYGITPVRNRAAILFSRRMGFKQTAPLPMYGSWHGEPEDVVMSFLTKEEYHGRRA
jgi:RimJ/RimL family protein N-acetyltransferase